MKVPARRLAAFSLASVLMASPLLSTTPAQAVSKPLTCRASMSDSTPKQYSNVSVRVKTGKPKAKVRTVAHYKTTKTTRFRKSNSKGLASVPYYISGSTPGFKVVVKVTVSKNGKTKKCQTSFKAHK